MAAIQEQCSVCGRAFEVTFRYQMEERDGGFAFFCTHGCLTASQTGGDTPAVSCDACVKRFVVKLASQVFYTGGRRHYACSMECRGQLVHEAAGVRLGDLVARDAAPQSRESETRAVASAAVQAEPTPYIEPRASASAEPAPVTLRAPRRIAVFNHKGGTGKTTTSVSLAAGLAARGKRVLLVDTDSQGNVAVSLGAKCERTLYHVLVMGLGLETATQEVRPGLELLPSNETLAAAELYLAGRQNRDRVLAQRIGAASEPYDFVVLDCSPSLSLMNQNALCFADSVLVPVACDYLSLVGVRQVLKTVKNVNTLLQHPLQIWGVLPTFYDSRARICRDALETLQSHFGERCLEPIRATTKIKEAPAQGTTIFEHAPGTYGADDYDVLVEQVLARPETTTRTAAAVQQASRRGRAPLVLTQEQP